MGNKQVVALSVDKVQTFLTEVIHAHVQEKQAEEATLKSILSSSREISTNFFAEIKERFSGDAGVDENVLLACSGVYIFESQLPEADIEARLNELFLHYYRSSQGQKFLRFTYFSTEAGQGAEDWKIRAVQEAKKRLKQSQTLNAVIEKNRDVLFSFCAQKRSSSKVTINYPMFAEDLNKLYREDVSDNANRFRIAVLKADLDGMGDMFKSIRDYETYQKISGILNEKISLDALHEAAESCRPEGRDGWLFPFYIAGDDIFFAVSIADLAAGADVCRKILDRVNKGLAATGIERKLSMSVGIDITFNRQPVRYYMEMVEQQLKNAKKAKTPPNLKKFLRMKISIAGLAYLDIDYKQYKKHRKSLKCLEYEDNNPRCDCENCEKRKVINQELQNSPIWSFFLTDVSILNYIKNQDQYKKLVGSTTFFYNLLERITDESVQGDEIKYFNNVFYQLIPEYLESPDKELRELELRIKTGVAKQLYKKGEGITIDEETKRRLETYLRLMLLFSDKRFQITKVRTMDIDKVFPKEMEEDTKRYLLNGALNYLERSLRIKKIRDKRGEENFKIQNLADVFARTVFYKYKVEKERNGKIKVEWKDASCLQLLDIEKSMFFRLRDTAKISVKRAADIIELTNPSTKDEIDAANEERSGKGKAPHRLFFEKKTFECLADRSKCWNPNFVDQLMLLYAYNDKKITFNRVMRDRKEEAVRDEK